jgi:hypothetical protein
LETPKRSFREKVARNLDRISLFGIWFLFMIFFISIIGSSYAPSEAVWKAVQSFFVLFSSVILFSFTVLFLYVSSKVISNINDLSVTSKYVMLRTYPFCIKNLVFSFVFLVVLSTSWSLLSQTFNIVPAFLANRLELVVSLFPSLLLAYAGFLQLIFLDVKSWNRRIEMELSFSVIQDFKTVALERTNRYYRTQFGEVWGHCLKRVVSYVEDRFKRVMGISEDFASKIYEAFNIVSLAAMTGDSDQLKNAKKWMEELGHIVTEKRLSASTKNRLIIEHLRKIKNDENWGSFRNIHSDFSFNYAFERGWRRLNKILGKTERTILFSVSIITFVLSVILPYLLPLITSSR